MTNIYRAAMDKLLKNTITTKREYTYILKTLNELVKEKEQNILVARTRYVVVAENKTLTGIGFKDLQLSKHRLATIKTFASMSTAKKFMQDHYPDFEYEVKQVNEIITFID